MTLDEFCPELSMEEQAWFGLIESAHTFSVQPAAATREGGEVSLCCENHRISGIMSRKEPCAGITRARLSFTCTPVSHVTLHEFLDLPGSQVSLL